jgi:hypothetical protein
MSSCCFAGRGVSLVALLIAGASTAAEKPVAERVAELMRQRRESLRTLVEARTLEVDAGRATADSLLEAARLFFHQNLELADKPADRQALCERFAPRVKEALESLEQRHKAGRCTDQEYTQARLACLEDEVLLARERLRAQPTHEGDLNLRKLLRDRREAYQAALLVLHTEVDAGRAVQLALLDTYRRSLRADAEIKDLRLFPSELDFVRMLQATLVQTRKVEETAKAAFEAGQLSMAEFAAARILRLSVDIYAAREKAKGADTPRVKRLLGERRDAAKDLVDAQQKLLEAGRADQHTMLEAARLLLEAELPLAEKATDRVALLRTYAEGLKKADDVDKSRLDAGRITRAIYETLRAARLAAEIDVARAEDTTK